MQRILMVVNIMDRGGVETLLMNIYRQVNRSQVQFDFLTHPYNQNYTMEYEDEIRKLGGRVYKAPRFVKNPIKYCLYIYSLFKKHPEYSIIHGHNLDSAALGYMSIAKLFGCTIIGHSHNTKDYGNWVRRFVLSVLRNIISLLCDYYFACSKAAGIFAYGKKRVSSRRFKVIHNGIDLNKFHNNDSTHYSFREKLFPNASGPIIGNVGRLSAQKNQLFLIRVFANYIKIDSSAKLVIIGKGDLDQNLKLYCKQLGVLSNVIFTGSVDNVYEYLKAMDLVIMPSLYEGISLSSIEAQSTGIPLLISDSIDPDCICVPSAVKVLKLTDPIDLWVQQAYYMIQNHNHFNDSIQQVRDAGYDIRDVSCDLIDFYKSIS